MKEKKKVNANGHILNLHHFSDSKKIKNHPQSGFLIDVIFMD